MSLFASLGQGDIWALSGISFESPINDLLEKGEFTLENLLEEDELIQEVKANNERLIDCLSREDTIDRLLDFIITPAEEGASEMRIFKYPYMSCEVICCEVPEILNALVERKDGRYLDKLFTFLDNRGKLDYYLAGYFEKILEMLFRRMTVPMMKYFNDAGTSLLSRFLNHMDNYSIMQIVQRLMLPHIPFASPNDNEAELSDEDRLLRQCNWSFYTESCQLLFDRMLDQSDADVPLHISDLLITVLQLSPPETLVISYLCEPPCIARLMRAVVGEGLNAGAEGEEPVLDLATPGDAYSSAASVSLAAISVLESLNSRLFEAGIPFDQSMGQVTEGNLEHLVAVREQVDAVCAELLPFVPQLHAALQVYLARTPCEPFKNQAKVEVNRLGHRGLQLVKLVESMVRLGNAAMDNSFRQHDIFRTCLELLFRFECNSFLHLSVQRIIITVLESDKSRSSTQRHLLTECGLLSSLMARIELYATAPSGAVQDSAPAEGGGGGVGTGKRSAGQPMAAKHTSVMGNLLLVAQALSVALDPEGGAQTEADNPLRSSSANNGADSSFSSSDPAAARTEGSAQSEQEGDCVASSGAIGFERPGSLRAVFSVQGGEANGPDAAAAESILADWDDFMQRTLHGILDHQMVGSYTNIANLSAMSQDDPMKLGVDLEMFNMGGQGGLHSEMAGEGWHRNHYEEEGDDEDDDFMFQGPATASRELEAGHGSTPFEATFADFSKRQDFTESGFNLDTGAPALEAFADFASFTDTPAVATADGGQADGFADFATFADFGDGDGTGPAKSSESAVDDFAPSVF